MARPGRPERNRAARSFRQLRRFHHVINSDMVFGTHSTLRQDRGAGGQTPFGAKEAETMSQTLSPSFARCYGLARVARVWKISRASVYRSLKETPPNPSARRPGPGGAC